MIHDKELRQNLQSNPKMYVKQLGTEIKEDIEIVIKINTPNITYLPIPSFSIEKADMMNYTAGDIKTSTAGSVGSGGILSTVGTTLGSLSSASTLGSIKI